MTDAQKALVTWFDDEYRRRTKAVAAGPAPINWIIPEYRVGFCEVCTKADELGIKMSLPDLRLWCDKHLRPRP